MRHPEPIGVSLLLGVALMVGHRRLALSYLAAVRPTTCVWCHRRLAEGVGEGPAALELVSGPRTIELRACPGHVEPTRRFFTFLDRARWPLRLGIALPLLALLAALAAGAAGAREALLPATELFRLAVGLTVHAAAAGGFFTTPAVRAHAAFPVHNFYLLGVRAILWIFRLVGVWWILAAGAYWLAR